MTLINYAMHTFSIDGINDFGIFMPTVESTNSTLVMESSGSSYQHEPKIQIVSDAQNKLTVILIIHTNKNLSMITNDMIHLLSPS